MMMIPADGSGPIGRFNAKTSKSQPVQPVDGTHAKKRRMNPIFDGKGAFHETFLPTAKINLQG
jgi:hypothetical protein